MPVVFFKTQSISALGRRSCGLRRPSTPFVSPVMKRPYEGSSKVEYSQLSLRWTSLGLALSVHLREVSVL